MPYWEKISSRSVFDHPRMHIVEDEVMLPDGTKTQYLRETDRRSFVTIIAKQAETILMVRDYSYPNDQMLLQFPEGVIDDGETPEYAAMRELQEETGFHTDTVEILGKAFNDHRRGTAEGFVCFAENTEDTGATHLEAEESYTETVHLSEAEIKDKIASGAIVQKNALTAWAIYCSKK
jgi:ADP-ribose pyrophosphatase